MAKKKEKDLEEIAEEMYPWLGKWLYAMPWGWSHSFGLQMCEELNQLLKKYNLEKEYEVVEIKEKYARLEWYGGLLTEEISKEYMEWLKKYETLSTQTCQVCGEKGKIENIGGGWLACVCPHHKIGFETFM